MRSLFSLLVLLLISSPVFADEPTKVSQEFIDGYIKTINGRSDGAKWLAASPFLAPGFKKSLKKAFAEGPDADPILLAQDYPDKGFQALSSTLKGDRATVLLKSRDPQFEHEFKFELTQEKGAWLITKSLPASR